MMYLKILNINIDIYTEKLNFEKNEIEKELEDKEKLTREDINKLTDKILEKDVVNI